jgi:transcriptional regulator of heat shock response
MEDLMQERTNILEEIEKQTTRSLKTTDAESQTDDDEREEIVQVNNQLKDVLQIFKDKIKRVVTGRSDLLDNIDEETSEQLEHLISTRENQAKEINVLHAQRDQIEEQLQNEIKQIQRLGTAHYLMNFI